MEIVDWAIVIVMALAVLGGLSQGFFRSFCALAGLVLGLAVADWNYSMVAKPIIPLVREEAVANAIAFLLIAFVVMGVAAIVGKVMSKAMHGVGLGCLDKLAGGVFGLLQGAVMVTLVIVVIVAFFPRAHWLAEARLPSIFWRLSFEHAHQPGGLVRAHPARPQVAGRRVSALAASRPQRCVILGQNKIPPNMAS